MQPAALDELVGDAVIMAIIIVKVILDFANEHRAEESLAALKQPAMPAVRIQRNGKSKARIADHYV